MQCRVSIYWEFDGVAVAMAVSSVEADLGGQTVAAGRGGRDGRGSGADKVDDGGDEGRGRDARILVRSRG